MFNKIIVASIALLVFTTIVWGFADSVDKAKSVADLIEEVESEDKTENEQGLVKLLVVDGPIGPITVDYINRGIKQAVLYDADALVVLLNTPGGLSNSTWKITEAIMNSPVPVIVYVYPKGARAASAGVFITYSAHIAAMAPATNMGSASSVALQGDMDSTMYKKVTNDAVANMRAVARERGRNEEWVERAIRESVSISDYDAVDSNVVDLVAENIPDLLDQIHGREVEVDTGTVVLNTKNARQDTVAKTFSEKILQIITNPNVAILLFSLGSLGLVLELYNPGAILPGVVGGICIILAFFSFQTLPINYAGLLLIMLSIILFILELKVPSYGVLTIGGAISLALGGIMLIDSPEPYLQVSKSVIVALVLVFVGFFGFALRYIIKTHKSKVTTGSEGLIGLTGRVVRDIDPVGMILVAGERWRAESSEKIEKDTKVRVVESDHMTLKVEKID
ncbi:MAG: nodulation protein NfeD [candidate division Zixibacteria bacterium]|nr:nodulation protein NfeD [candidate division Zixibacteria bacterium]